MMVPKPVRSALLLLFIRQCFAYVDSVPVKVAQFTTFQGIKCFQTDLANLASKSMALNIGNEFHVAHVGANIIGRFFEDFSLANHIDSLMILTPDRTNSTCVKSAHCMATIIIVNQVFTSGTSKCFDVLHGHYYHQELKEITDFKIANIVPYRLTCNSHNINSLLRQDGIHLSVTDIWSPVEDIANSAVAQIKNIGTQFTDEINDQIMQLQKILGSQIDQVSLAVQQNSQAVIVEVTNGYQAVGKQLDTIETIVEKDVSVVGYYAHVFLHVVEFLGTIVVLVILYKIYKKARGIYHLFHWIWSHVRPHPHPRPQPHQPGPQQPQPQPRN